MESYDFFISYKWSKYSAQAKVLRDIATSRGFTAWLDIDHPFQVEGQESHDSDESLARHLKNAMDSCRYILFFETFAVMAMQMGGPSIRIISWQEREFGMVDSDKLITLYHGASPRNIGFGSSTKLHEYKELSDAFAMIQEAIADKAHQFWG
jgi:hypothetical protein